MQKCIQGANPSQKARLIEEIVNNTQAFIRDAFGNYVVQFVLDEKDFDVNTGIGNKLLGSLIELGNQKFSSNVIEKCLELNHREMKNKIVKEMLTADGYLNFLTDQYGNYVIQKTLGVAEKDDLEKLIAKIKPDMEKLKEHSDFGLKIYNKLVKTYPSLQPKSAKTNKNKAKYKKGKANKRKNMSDANGIIEGPGRPELNSYAQHNMNIMSRVGQMPIYPLQSYASYDQDFSFQNNESSYYGYPQMSNAQPFMYHNEVNEMCAPYNLDKK